MSFLCFCHLVLPFLSPDVVENNKSYFKGKVMQVIYPGGSYLLKVNNGNTRTMCGICSKLTTKTPKRDKVSLLLTLNILNTLF